MILTKEQLLETNARQAERINELEQQVEELEGIVNLLKDAARLNVRVFLDDLEKLKKETNGD